MKISNCVVLWLYVLDAKFNEARDKHSTRVLHGLNHDIAFSSWYTARTRLCGGSVVMLNTIRSQIPSIPSFNLGEKVSLNLNYRTSSGAPCN
jgi:hypothetical protein